MGIHDSSGPRYEDSVKLVKRSKPEAPLQPGILVKEDKMRLPVQEDTKPVLPVGRVVVATRDVGALRKGQRYKIEKVLSPEPGVADYKYQDYRYYLEGITGWTTAENIEPVHLTLDEMTAEFNQLVAQRDDLENQIVALGIKLNWMRENKRDQFDELEYEVFKTLIKLQSSSIPEASTELTRFIREFIKK